MKQLLSGNLSSEAATLIAAFLVPVVSAGAAPPTYSLIPLGLVSTPQICENGVATPEGTDINAAGDATGIYCLQNVTPQGELRGFLWTQQRGALDLGLPAGVTDPTTIVSPSGINASRQITGTAASSQLTGRDNVFIWDRGTFTLIPNAELSSINDPGQVAGTTTSPAQHAFLYSHGKFMDLGVGVAGAGNSRAADINNSGHIDGVAGFVNTGGTFSEVLILWTGTAWRNLGDPPTNDSFLQPGGINNLDEIVGTSFNNNSPASHPFVWRDGAYTVLPCLPNQNCGASSINDAGTIVGGTNTVGVVWFDGHPYDLNALIDTKDPLHNQVKILSGSINARGDILSDGIYTSGPNNGRVEVFVLSPGHHDTVARQ